MDRLDIALRRYRQIIPEGNASISQPQRNQLVDWLEQDVCAVVDELVQKPEFRRHSTWPIKRLTGETECEERRLVEEVDRLLVESATRTVQWMQHDAVREHVINSVDANNNPAEAANALPDGLAADLAAVEFIATRPWRDLVYKDDYFYPWGQLNLKGDNGTMWAAFVPALNAEIDTPGDYVSRSLLIRVQHWMTRLERLWRHCGRIVRECPDDLQRTWQPVAATREQLREKHAALRTLVASGAEARLRSSCIALLQVYAAHRPYEDVKWLWMPHNCVAFSQEIRRRIRDDRNVKVSERIAAALVDVKALYRLPSPPEDEVEEARQNHRLVLAERPRRGFWDGKPLDVDWEKNSAQWELLWRLAEKVRWDQGVECHDFAPPLSRDAIRNRKSRLVQILPRGLHSLIVSDEEMDYRLRLSGNEVALIAEARAE